MRYSNTDLMEKAPVFTAILRLAVPTVLGILIQLVYNITDTYFIGLLDDYNQIAAVSLALPIMMVTNALSHIFSAGAPSWISRLLGKKEYNEVKKTAAFAFYTTAILGLFVSIIMLIFLPPILHLIGASDATYGYTRDYIFIILLFSVISMTQGTLQGLLRSEGATKHASIGLVIGAVANIILDPIFIFLFHLGVKGAAIATILGNGFSFLYFIIILKKQGTYISINPKYYRPNATMVREVLSIGLPSSLSQIIMSISAIFVNNFASSYGDYVVAAMGIASKIYVITYMITMGLSMGLQPFIGYNYGAKNLKRLFAGFRVSWFLGTGVCLLFTLFFALGAHWFIGQFSSDPDVIAVGVRSMTFSLVSVPLLATQMTFMTYLQSTGQAVKAMIVTLSRQFLILLPAIFILNRFLRLDGLLLSAPVSDVLTTILSSFLVLPGIIKLQRQMEKGVYV